MHPRSISALFRYLAYLYIHDPQSSMNASFSTCLVKNPLYRLGRQCGRKKYMRDRSFPARRLPSPTYNLQSHLSVLSAKKPVDDYARALESANDNDKIEVRKG